MRTFSLPLLVATRADPLRISVGATKIPTTDVVGFRLSIVVYSDRNRTVPVRISFGITNFSTINSQAPNRLYRDLSIID